MACNKEMMDHILRTLLDKKIELLDYLLKLSQLDAMMPYDPATDLRQEERREILEQLETNDRCIGQREQQLAVNSRHLFTDHYQTIKTTLESISYNNQNALKELSRGKDRLKKEQRKMGQTNKLSGYISTQKSYQSFKPIIPKVDKKQLSEKSTAESKNRGGLTRYLKGKYENKSTAR